MKENFYTLPQAMYTLKAIDIILANGNNAILYKKLDSSMLNMEKIIISHSIVYVKSGVVEVGTFDYKSIQISDGEMLFMPRDSYLISDYIKEGADMEVYLIFFDHHISSEFSNSVESTCKSSSETLLKLSVSENILHYIDTLSHVRYAQKDNEHLLKIKIFELLHLICEENQAFIPLLKTQENTKSDIKGYMIAHYDKNLGVGDWANLMGYSLSTFNRKFKEHYGVSPKQWIIQHNMQLALKDLANGLNVTKCASKFGYTNSSNFIKAFKKVHKMTPKQYNMTQKDSF